MNANEIVKAMRRIREVRIFGNDQTQLMADAADLIESLQAQLAESQRREQAAVVDMERMANSSPIGRCIFCKHEHDEYCKHGGKCFKWRGNILRR